MTTHIRRGATLAAVLVSLFSVAPLAVNAQNDNTLPGAEWIVRLPEVDDKLAPRAPNASQQVRVRMIQAVPGKSLDLTINGVRTFTSVAFERATPYQKIASNRLTISAHNPGIAAATATQTLPVEADRSYTVVAYAGPRGSVALRVLPDRPAPAATVVSAAPVPKDSARVRVVNATPDKGEVSVYAHGSVTPLFSPVVGGDATQYVQMPAGNSALEVGRASAARETRLTLPVIRLEPGKVYTLVLAGLPGSRGRVVATLVEDAV